MENMETHKESPNHPKDLDLQNWKAMTQPSDAHQVLEDTVGTFNYTIRMWMDHDTHSHEEKGKSVNKWILGGRYVEQQITGNSMADVPFAGVGITGYDNFRQEYQSIWMDNMSTGIAWSEGKFTGNKRVIEQTGTSSKPMKNDKNSWFRTVLHIINKDEHTYVMYAKDEDGVEYKCMEIKYVRA